MPRVVLDGTSFAQLLRRDPQGLPDTLVHLSVLHLGVLEVSLPALIDRKEGVSHGQYSGERRRMRAIIQEEREDLLVHVMGDADIMGAIGEQIV